MAENFTYVASSNISPMRFVGLVPGSPYTVAQCDASGVPVGVSGMDLERFDGTYHATDGKPVRVFGDGETALLELGGTVSAGDYLAPDSGGKGVAVSLTATAHDDWGAYALKNGFSGEFIQVRVHKGSGVMLN